MGLGRVRISWGILSKLQWLIVVDLYLSSSSCFFPQGKVSWQECLGLLTLLSTEPNSNKNYNYG